MKTAALILGICSVLTCSSCRCDFDEDEPEKKYDRKENAGNPARHDTVQVK